MRSPFLILIFLLAFAQPLCAHSEEVTGLVRVGIFPFKPINFIDPQGTARGLYPDLLREIVAEEGWSLEFVPGTWAQGLERLQSEEIDLMTTIAYTPERARVMDFNQEAVVNIWGQVYLLPGSKINTMNDLEGLRVAITERDISGENFLKTQHDLGVNSLIKTYPRHEDVFLALQNGEVDAAVAPSQFGLRHAGNYGLAPSSIQFSPFSIFFASKKGHFNHLLKHIDEHLSRWKADEKSFYYQRLNYWMGDQAGSKEIVPIWLLISLGLVVLLALVFFASSLAFKSQVRKATLELSMREREYRRLIQSINNIVLQVDQQGTILFINRYGLEFFGFGKEEILGKNVLETIVPEQESSGRTLAPMVDEILSSPDGFEIVENENICKDGRRVYIQWRNRPELDESGKLTGMLSVGADITERRRDETELRSQEEKFRTLFEHVADYALVLQPQEAGLVIVDLNESACHAHGYTRDELIGKPISFLDVESVPVDDLRMQRLYSGESIRFEVVHRRKDGSTFPIEVAAKMLEIDGETLLFTIERDLTARKQAEAEKVELEKSLQQKFKMEAIGTLAGGIAHDFNNVLAIILGSGTLLRRALTDDTEKLNKVERILKAADRAKNLVEQVLAFSRQHEQTLSPVLMSELIVETTDLLRSIVPRTVEFRLDFAAGSEGLCVEADPVQLQQVLINLCNNAVFAMREEGILEIGLAVAPDELCPSDSPNSDSSGYLLLSVRDSGEGIRPGDLEKIFDPFFTTKDFGQGTGMGLSVVHGIVQSHRGTIQVDSRPGEGSCFQVLLPLTCEEVVTGAETKRPFPIGSERILLVDDESDLLIWGEEVLKGQGFLTTSFADSQAALRFFLREPSAFDLLVTDQSMPGLSGLELIAEIRQVRSDFPVVLCSGYSTRISEQVLQQQQINGYLNKPYRERQLLEAIRSCLDK